MYLVKSNLSIIHDQNVPAILPTFVVALIESIPGIIYLTVFLNFLF